METIILKTPLFDIGKWDPETDDSEMVQLFISSSAISFLLICYNLKIKKCLNLKLCFKNV